MSCMLWWVKLTNGRWWSSSAATCGVRVVLTTQCWPCKPISFVWITQIIVYIIVIDSIRRYPKSLSITPCCKDYTRQPMGLTHHEKKRPGLIPFLYRNHCHETSLISSENNIVSQSPNLPTCFILISTKSNESSLVLC